MKRQKARKLATITIVYWLVLLYIIAALVYWFISLQQQNTKMTALLLNELKHDEPAYYNKVAAIQDAKSRKTTQYISEGTTFLALILVGAVFVYRIIRRRLTLSMQQQNFMMAVTHELKTPIAVARLNLETLQKRKLETERQEKLIQITLDEVNRLNSLCNNILLASQLDAGDYKVSKTEVNLSELAQRVFSSFASRYPARQMDSQIEENIVIKGEELLLELLVSNLLENAVKYSPKNSPVAIGLQKSGNHIYLLVKDAGAGIAEEERIKIFEKFYRIGNETTRVSKGTGLGLYLCQQIAKDHHAEISAGNNERAGAVLTVKFKTA